MGILPALLVFWIRRSVPEPEECACAIAKAKDNAPSVAELFEESGPAHHPLDDCCLRHLLGAWWAFMFWHVQHLRNLPEIKSLARR